MYNFLYNMDNNLRMNIITEEDYDWTNSSSSIVKEIKMNGDIFNFTITRDIFDELIENNFVDLCDRQNNAFSIEEFIAFCDKYPDEDFEFIGYAVMPSREDYRISIEGLICYTLNRNLVVDFITTFKTANELSYTDDELRCWYD